MNKKEIPYAIFICTLLLGPWIAGPILFACHHPLAGILAFVIPYGCLALIAFLRKRKQQKEMFKIPNAHTRFTVIQVTEPEKIRKLKKGSALTFREDLSDNRLDMVFNWLNNEGVLKLESDSLNLYVYDGKLLKEACGKKKRFGDEERFMSIDLRDLDLNDSNMRQFSLDHFNIGGRWLDDIVGNS